MLSISSQSHTTQHTLHCLHTLSTALDALITHHTAHPALSPHTQHSTRRTPPHRRRTPPRGDGHGRHGGGNMRGREVNDGGGERNMRWAHGGGGVVWRSGEKERGVWGEHTVWTKPRRCWLTSKGMRGREKQGDERMKGRIVAAGTCEKMFWLVDVNIYKKRKKDEGGRRRRKWTKINENER